jgi:tetrathionate reductase subunit C
MNTIVEVLGFAREPAWLPWAVQYFFLIGISTAGFVLSLPGLVWRRHAWRRVSRRALLVALICGLAAPVALLADLHQPGRFLNFYLQPNFGSWMAWGSFFIPLYLFGLLLYAWLCLRPLFGHLVNDAETHGLPARFYHAMAYGGYDNRGAILGAATLAALGALLVLLYTGMEVMVVHARPLWNSVVVPLLFAASAFSGALGLIALFEVFAGKATSALRLNLWLARSQWTVLALLAAWVVLAVSTMGAEAEALASMGGGLGWPLTLLWLAGISGLGLVLSHMRRHALLLPALLALLTAWTVRWVVFIGGQGLPKMGTTFREYFVSTAPDGVVGVIGTAGLCLTLYILLTSFIPWDDPTEAKGERS